MSQWSTLWVIGIRSAKHLCRRRKTTSGMSIYDIQRLYLPGCQPSFCFFSFNSATIKILRFPFLLSGTNTIPWMCSYTLVCCVLWKGDFVCAVRSLGCLLSNSFESQSHRQYRLRVKAGFSFVFKPVASTDPVFSQQTQSDLCISKYFR